MNISELLVEMQQGPLQSWAEQLPTQIAKGLNIKRYGDLPRWQAVVAALPQVSPSSIDLNSGCLRIGVAKDVNTTLQHQIETTLRQLHPWRKGPYDVFGIHIDTEWRSDWKWDRLKDHIQPLAGRRVLDVGCGNGYHCWRMYAAGAKRVIGIDPTPLFIMQFQALKHFIGQAPVYVLPLGIDDVPPQLEAFDTAFSMGVLYHRRSPVDHILQLRDCLKPGGELVLETLVIEGDENTVLLPEDRYARMGNVWFIPSVAMLEKWLRRCKLVNIKVVDVTTTSLQEQRSTDWMTFQSLKDYLDPSDASKSIEGYPAPQRAILTATKS
ncbi:MAG: tRNA 5-methoxyuridine(34)/uridine 5-oxyacetic acid(34) synthase CmoB [Halobacteria archaeon]|nr:tRNA 5-methoxyuridine(34)/uridine 5-oxyacetic acid(34) synthase CmoB [Halobacteria archaeon]